MLGKRPDLKLKSVTIIHSSTTETVRLPPEGEGGVTVHPPAVRAKLPLSRKVREKRRRRKHNKSATVGGPTSTEKPAKSGKKKRVAPAAVAAGTDDPAVSRKRVADGLLASGAKHKKEKPKEKEKHTEISNKKRRKKEVIDYSAAQTENETLSDSDPKSKVRSWLLASQARTNERSGLPKSKSTPAGLTSGGRNPPGRTRQITLRRPTDPKARSLGSIARSDKNDRVRLQVVYKPPFKFSVKLRKADKVAATGTAHGTPAARTSAPRTGVLVRTKARSNKARAKQATPNKTTNAAQDHSANSDLHTVPSDLEVLLSECEFLRES